MNPDFAEVIFTQGRHALKVAEATEANIKIARKGLPKEFKQKEFQFEI
jgi:hypothetical protein